MKLLLSTPGIDSKLHKSVEGHLNHILPHISKRLGRHDNHSRTLRAKVTVDGKTEERPVYHVTLSLQLPEHPVVVHKSGYDAHVVVSEAEIAIKKELRRSVSKLRAEYLLRKRQSERRQFQNFAVEVTETPTLSGSLAHASSETSDSHPVFARLRPILSHLHHYAQGHLQSAVVSGDLPANYLAPDDLVDQAILAMMESDKNLMSDPVLLERSLFQEIDVVLEKEIKSNKENPTISLEQSAPYNEQWGVHGPEIEEKEYHKPYEALMMEDIIIDDDLPLRSNNLTEKEEHRMILKNLAGFHSKARSAFFLSKIEGFELFEIAMIQNRSEEAVQEDIVKCVGYLKASWGELHKKFAEGKEAV